MKKKILVIDDDPIFTRLVSHNLAIQGYDIISASNGDEGINLARDKQPDLIVLDLVLPGIDGWEVYKKLTRSHQIPIIIITAVSNLASIYSQNDGMEEPAYVISKPFIPSELINMINTIFFERA